uniref:lysozyme g-like n=1 Tax=Styela clava TaxID=7725 RepID=UPI0019394A1A|nr:lysozyme g-like [Styela clava]
MKIVVVLALIGLAAASDWGCTKDGGTCQDYRNAVCTAGYETGLCDGDSNRRCCLQCSASCASSEAMYSQNDGECDTAGGDCHHNSNYCDGTYYNGKCGGPSERQCCVSSGGGGLIGGGIGCSSTKYGNIRNVDTTGASYATASQDGLSGGVSSSHKMAQNDKNAMLQYKSLIQTAANDLCMDAAVIAGIISRETRAGKVLGSDGFGYDGHGYGLMQVDDRYHTLQGGPYSLAHIKQGTGILIDMINGVKNKHPSWSQDMALKGGISAYNAGVSNVDSYNNMDVGTTGNDYANDVVARSQWYDDNGY